MRPSWLPGVGDIIFIFILLLFFVSLPNFIFGDGSTGWHLVTGQYVLNHFQVPRTDLISYTFPDKPWVAYEWLFDALIAALERIAGLKLVAVACCSAIAWLFLLLYEDCRKRGCHFFLALVLCIIGALVSAIHWLARPHLVTFFGLYFFCKYLDKFYKGEVSPLKLMIVLGLTMLIWVNSHPAFLMGIVVTGIYLVSDLAIFSCSGTAEIRESCWKRIKALALCLLVVCGITLINPYGPNLYRYIVDYLHQSVVLSQNDEFGSPEFHGQLQTALLEVLYFLLAAGLVCTSKKPTLPGFLTVLAYVHLSLAGRRNMPLFVIVSLPFIAELLANSRFTALIASNAFPFASWLDSARQKWNSLGETMDSIEFTCTRHALPAVAVAVLAISCLNGGKALGVTLVRSEFDPKTKPVKTLDCLRNAKLDEKHGFSFDNWGGYIRYKTGYRVFIDDRSDFYGQKHYLEYADAATIQPGWKQTLARHHIEWVLFPNNSVLAAHLKLAPDWTVLCQDEASSLLIRKPSLQDTSLPSH